MDDSLKGNRATFVIHLVTRTHPRLVPSITPQWLPPPPLALLLNPRCHLNKECFSINFSLLFFIRWTLSRSFFLTQFFSRSLLPWGYLPVLVFSILMSTITSYSLSSFRWWPSWSKPASSSSLPFMTSSLQIFSPSELSDNKNCQKWFGAKGQTKIEEKYCSKDPTSGSDLNGVRHLRKPSTIRSSCKVCPTNFLTESKSEQINHHNSCSVLELVDWIHFQQLGVNADMLFTAKTISSLFGLEALSNILIFWL